MKTVDGYIAGLAGWRKAVAKRLRAIVKEAAPGAEEAIKWGHPVYSDHGPVAYFRAYENSVNLGFWRGIELEDPQGLLQGSGEQMRHLKLTGGEAIDKAAITEFVRQAAMLNRSKGDPTRGS